MCGPISCDLWQAVWVKNSMTPQSTKPLISLLPYLCSPLKTPSFASFVIMSKLEASKSIKIFHLFLEPSFVFVLLLFFLVKEVKCLWGKKKRCILNKMEKQGTCNTNSWTYTHDGSEYKENLHSLMFHFFNWVGSSCAPLPHHDNSTYIWIDQIVYDPHRR